jgi:hypothetical protein
LVHRGLGRGRIGEVGSAERRRFGRGMITNLRYRIA